MKILFVMMVLIFGFSSGVLAQEISVVSKDVAQALQNEGIITADEVPVVGVSLEKLIQNGLAAGEAKKFVEGVLMQAKVQGLAGEQLSSRLQEAVHVRLAELPAAEKTMEHPVASTMPKEHPAH